MSLLLLFQSLFTPSVVEPPLVPAPIIEYKFIVKLLDEVNYRVKADVIHYRVKAEEIKFRIKPST